MLPGTVLVKFNVNSKWEARFREAGIPVKTPNEMALLMNHALEAVEMGRNPNEWREEPDSGIPAFGPGGETKVEVASLLAELRNEGYKPSGIHIRVRQGKKFNVLVVPYLLWTAKGEVLPPLLEEFLKISSWGFAHVWMNPPKADGSIVHTVNLSHREEGSPEKILQLRKGRWRAIPR